MDVVELMVVINLKTVVAVPDNQLVADDNEDYREEV